jgi:hypothetical protein
MALVMTRSQALGGRDYPRTFAEFNAWFQDEGACRAYLARLRWPGGFVCPSCGEARGWQLSRWRVRCASCRAEISVTAGTIFADTHLPLTTWFAAAWHVTNQKGVSALGLQRALGLRRYETSWLILHKLRRAMVRPGRDKLAGELEVDESYLGGPKGRKPGRGLVGKAIAAIAVEAMPGGTSGRIRACPHPRLLAGRPYRLRRRGGRTRLGRLHRPLERLQRPQDGRLPPPPDQRRGQRRPRARRHAARPPRRLTAQRWLLGTHHGGVRARQLDFYLDEFVFRFNRRQSRSRGLLFYRLLEQAAQLEPIIAREIVGGRS